MDYLTSKQLSEWEAFLRIDPIDSLKDDIRIAGLESLITNIVQQLYADPKKGKPTSTTPLDFIIDWVGEEKEPKKQSVEEMKAILMGLAKDQNKRVAGQNKPPVKKLNKKP